MLATDQVSSVVDKCCLGLPRGLWLLTPHKYLPVVFFQLFTKPIGETARLREHRTVRKAQVMTGLWLMRLGRLCG